MPGARDCGYEGLAKLIAHLWGGTAEASVLHEDINTLAILHVRSVADKPAVRYKQLNTIHNQQTADDRSILLYSW